MVSRASRTPFLLAPMSRAESRASCPTGPEERHHARDRSRPQPTTATWTSTPLRSRDGKSALSAQKKPVAKMSPMRRAWRSDAPCGTFFRVESAKGTRTNSACQPCNPSSCDLHPNNPPFTHLLTSLLHLNFQTGKSSPRGSKNIAHNRW